MSQFNEEKYTIFDQLLFSTNKMGPSLKCKQIITSEFFPRKKSFVLFLKSSNFQQLPVYLHGLSLLAIMQALYKGDAQ